MPLTNMDAPIRPLVNPDCPALRLGQTVGEVLTSLRSLNLAQKIVYFYVVDAERQLRGVVPTRRLLMTQPETKIETIMIDQLVTIPDTATVLDACEFFVMYRLLAFPVVDRENHLLGVVDVSLFTDEMQDVAAAQTARDIFQLIGVRMAEGKRASPWAGFANRFPWLLCNIAGGLCCALIAGLHAHLLSVRVVLAFFVPMVLTLAESVSIQSMTITIQALHAGRHAGGKFVRALLTEFLTAAMLGSASGLLVGLTAAVWKHEYDAAVAIGVAVALAIVTAALLGVMLPTVVRAFRGDPHLAAGPIVLAVADLATLTFYFELASHMLSK
jgi:magnesium transporter